MIIKSPGISFKNIDISPFKDKISSQLQLFLSFFNGKTIGITGTKGKSTTSSLLYRIIKEQNHNVTLLGNIGTPIFDSLDILKDDTFVVLEISSHQLEYMRKSPNIAVLLNVFEEHLDHYHSFIDYSNAKYNIFKFQNDNDFSIYNMDNIIIQNLLKEEKIHSKQIGITFENKENNNSIFIKDNFIVYKENNFEYKLYDVNSDRKLLGNHNLFNIMACLSICKILNLDIAKATLAINNFETLPHRMEFVGEYNGIKYYNDSIATIPEATISCVESLKDVHTLIIGGMDRKIDYSNFIKFILESKIENIICMPDVGTFIGNEILKIQKEKNYFKKIYIAQTMEEVVDISKKVTKQNNICLLSPAASSYGFFKNFKERGEKFKDLLKQ